MAGRAQAPSEAEGLARLLAARRGSVPPAGTPGRRSPGSRELTQQLEVARAVDRAAARLVAARMVRGLHVADRGARASRARPRAARSSRRSGRCRTTAAGPAGSTSSTRSRPCGVRSVKMPGWSTSVLTGSNSSTMPASSQIGAIALRLVIIAARCARRVAARDRHAGGDDQRARAEAPGGGARTRAPTAAARPAPRSSTAARAARPACW